MSWEDILKQDNVHKELLPGRRERAKLEAQGKKTPPRTVTPVEPQSVTLNRISQEKKRGRRKLKRGEKEKQQLENQLNPKESFWEKGARALGFGPRSPEEKQIAALKIQAEKEENARIAEERRLAEQAEIATEDEEDAKAARSKTALRGAETRRTRKEGDDWLTEIREDMEREDEEIAEKERLASLSPEEWRKEKTPLVSNLVDKPRGKTEFERLLESGKKLSPRERFPALSALRDSARKVKEKEDKGRTRNRESYDRWQESLQDPDYVSRTELNRRQDEKDKFNEAFDEATGENERRDISEAQRREREERLGSASRAQMRNAQGDAAQMVADVVTGKGKEIYGKGKDWWERVKAKKRIKDRRKSIESDDDDFDERFSRLRQPEEESKENWWDSVAKPKIESTKDWAKQTGKDYLEGRREKKDQRALDFHNKRLQQEMRMMGNIDDQDMAIQRGRQRKKNKIMSAVDQKKKIMDVPESERPQGWRKTVRSLDRKIPINWEKKFGAKDEPLPESDPEFKMPSRDLYDWRQTLQRNKEQRKEEGTKPWHQRMLGKVKDEFKLRPREEVQEVPESDTQEGANWQEGSMGKPAPKDGQLSDDGQWKYSAAEGDWVSNAHERAVDPTPDPTPQEQQQAQKPEEKEPEEELTISDETTQPPKETFAEEEKEEEMKPDEPEPEEQS